MKNKLIQKAFYCAITITVLLGGCDKNDDPQPVPCLLTSQITEGGSTTFTYTFTYSGQQAVTTTTASAFNGVPGGSITGTFKYDGSGNIAEINYSGSTRDVFTYSNDVITKREKY